MLSALLSTLMMTGYALSGRSVSGDQSLGYAQSANNVFNISPRVSDAGTLHIDMHLPVS